MTTIPGTDYQISGSLFQTKDGTVVSQQQFLDKVKNKEISLTEDSLKVIEGHVGPDMMKSLRTESGLSTTPPGEVLEKMTQDEGNLDDLCALLKLMVMLGFEQSKSIDMVRQTEFKAQIGAMKDSLEEDKKAAVARLVSGVVSGVFSIGAGGVGIAGSMGAFGNLGLESSMKMGEGISNIVSGAGKLVTSMIDKAGSDNEMRSKEFQITSDEFRERVAQSQRVYDSTLDNNQKIKESLQLTVRSKNEIMSTSVRG